MSRWLGVPVALLQIGAWAGCLFALLTRVDPWAASPLSILAAIALQTWLYTGLFIVGHDAMHGTVAPGDRRLNDAIGTLAVGLYAGFGFRRLRAAHHAHHRHAATADDPDFHDGDPRLHRWMLAFGRRYVRPYQLVSIAAVYNLLHHGAGIGLAPLNLFFVVPSLLSVAQLFVVGTWLPHRPLPDGYPDHRRARPVDLPPWLSLLACYHFGYHRTHHARPGVPWWKLPAARQSPDGDP